MDMAVIFGLTANYQGGIPKPARWLGVAPGPDGGRERSSRRGQAAQTIPAEAFRLSSDVLDL